MARRGEVGAVIMETTANGEIRALPNQAPHLENANENDANGNVDEEKGVEEKMQFYPTTSVRQKNYIVRQINGALILWASRPALASVVVSRLSRPIICCIFNFSRFSCFNLNFPILCGGVEVEPILCPLLDERSQ